MKYKRSSQLSIANYEEKNFFASIVSNLTLQLIVAVQICYICFRIVLLLLPNQSIFRCKQENRRYYRESASTTLEITVTCRMTTYKKMGRRKKNA
jgi:hypothetical protein